MRELDPNVSVLSPNVGVLAHGDADGITAAAIIKTRYPGALILFSKASQLHKDIKEIEKWAKTLDTLYIVDLAVNPKTYEYVLDRLKKVNKKYKIFFIDNHLLPWEIPQSKIDNIDITKYVDVYLRRENWSSSALTFSLIYGTDKKTIIKYRRAALLGAYGAVADYAKDCEFLIDIVNLWDETSIYYQAYLLKQASRIIQSNDLKRIIADKLSVGILPSEIGEVVEAARESSREVDAAIQFIADNALKYNNIGVLAECPVASMGHNAFVTATMTDQPVGVAISRKSGDAYFVLRKQHHETIHLGELATKVAMDLDCDGGGESATAGITAADDQIMKVLNTIDKYVVDYLTKL